MMARVQPAVFWLLSVSPCVPGTPPTVYVPLPPACTSAVTSAERTYMQGSGGSRRRPIRRRGSCAVTRRPGSRSVVPAGVVKLTASSRKALTSSPP